MSESVNHVFLHKENKELLWELMHNSQYFKGLGQNSYNQVVETFDRVIHQVYEKNRESSVMSLNKQFLVEIKPHIENMRTRYITSNRPHMHTHQQTRRENSHAMGKGVLKSEYTDELHAKAKRHENDMLELLIPKVPPSIDFTTHQPYNREVEMAMEKIDEVVNEENIAALLDAKMKARERSFQLHSNKQPHQHQYEPNATDGTQGHEQKRTNDGTENSITAEDTFKLDESASASDALILKPSEVVEIEICEKDIEEEREYGGAPRLACRNPTHGSPSGRQPSWAINSVRSLSLSSTDDTTPIHDASLLSGWNPNMATSPNHSKNSVRFHPQDTYISSETDESSNITRSKTTCDVRDGISHILHFIIQEQRTTNKLLEKNNELLQQLIHKIE